MLNNKEIYKYIGVSFSGISLLSSLIFIILFFSNSQSSKLFLKLIFCIQTSDAIFAIGIILSVTPIETEVAFCHLQAFLLQFGALFSILCRLALTIIMYLALQKDHVFFESFETKVFLGVGVSSLIISAIPFMTDAYGLNGIWCWIAYGSDDYKGYWTSFFAFYLELWVSIIIIMGLSIVISNSLKTFECKSAVRKLRNKVKYYPIVLIICWILPTIERILTLFDVYCETLVILHIITMSLQGFFNFLLFSYGFVKKSIKRSIKELKTNNLAQNILFINSSDEEMIHC